MSETDNTQNTAAAGEVTQDEREALKARATQMGIEFPANVKTEKLKQLIQDKLAEGDVPKEANTKSEKTQVLSTEGEKLTAMIQEQTKLVRIRLTCMNPMKTSWNGEIFTVSNRYVNIKRFVPFNAPDGWHVEAMLLKMIKERKCQVFYTERVNGAKVRKNKEINEFSVEVLPALTEEELAELAAKQSAGKNIDA